MGQSVYMSDFIMEVHQSTVSSLERGVFPLRHSTRFHKAFARIGIPLSEWIHKYEKKQLQNPDASMFSYVQSLPDTIQKEIQNKLSYQFKFEKRIQNISLGAISEQAQVELSILDQIEKGQYPLPTAEEDSLVWMRVFRSLHLSFVEEFRESIMAYQISS